MEASEARDIAESFQDTVVYSSEAFKTVMSFVAFASNVGEKETCVHIDNVENTCVLVDLLERLGYVVFWDRLSGSRSPFSFDISWRVLDE